MSVRSIKNLKHILTLTRLRNVVLLLLLIAGVAVAPTEAQDSGGGPRPPCSGLVTLSESFDSLTPPALPTDWLATNALGPPPLWVTLNSGVPVPLADTTPNAAFIDDPAVVSDKRLDSLHFPVAAATPRMTFRQNFNLEASNVDPNLGFDGGVTPPPRPTPAPRPVPSTPPSPHATPAFTPVPRPSA